MANKQKISVKGTEITFETEGEDNYISLNDIAKQSETRADELIRGWLSNSATLQFIQTREELSNPDFNSVRLDGIT